MLKKDTLILLRMPFFIFLLPVFLFAWSQTPSAEWEEVLVVFILLHVLLYPSANGYAAYHNRNPAEVNGPSPRPLPERQLFWLVSAMDILTVFIAFQLSLLFAIQIIGFILASRLHTRLRGGLKNYPVAGFLWKSFFYGAFIYWTVQTGLGGPHSDFAAFTAQPWGKLIASVLTGAMFLFTQVYRNDLNKRDGIITLSGQLGYTGSFVFFGILMILAETGAWFHFRELASPRFFWVFTLFLIPLFVYIIFWFNLVRKDQIAADFDHATRMKLLTSLCLNLCFISFLISRYLAD